MSKCIYKEIAKSLNKNELENYYKTHTSYQTSEYFKFPYHHLKNILKFLGIKVRTPSESGKMCWDNKTQEERKMFSERTSQQLKGRPCSETTRKKISSSNKGRKSKPNNSSFKKGNIPWNKGLKGAQIWSEEQRIKYNTSMNSNAWFHHKTKREIEVETYLKTLFDKKDIIYQYRDDKRYPFNCDFYIKSLDLFIEVNEYWTHGPHRFDIHNSKDLELLKEWELKSKDKPQYLNAIETWTVRDIRKFEYANKYNLKYVALYHNDNISLITNSLAI